MRGRPSLAAVALATGISESDCMNITATYENFHSMRYTAHRPEKRERAHTRTAHSLPLVTVESTIKLNDTIPCIHRFD